MTQKADVCQSALNAIKNAQEHGFHHYVLFAHGWSTSCTGSTTASLQVRKLMKNKEAVLYIVRHKFIQHESVLVAAIKPMDTTVPQLKKRRG